MQLTARPRLSRAFGLTSFAAAAALLTACASPQTGATVNKPRSKEYFAESEYGVKASPRVTSNRHGIRRGGGRDQVGKPYKVRGKWYYPKEYKHYSKVGAASWYGDAFHGRLTANGEIYDTEHLTAAHPTMPLPSYARVTNMANGSSVIVRVNDRGPYHDGRIIDLSKRAAQMLGYAQVGTTEVKVDYIGRAPLEGDDEPYLMASYHPGKRAADPSVGLPTGVMVAMNGPTPSASIGQGVAPFPGRLDAASGPVQATASLADLVLPEFGPLVPQRPDFDLPQKPPFAMASLSYADERIAGATAAFAAFDRSAMTSSAVAASWRRLSPASKRTQLNDYVAAGSWPDKAEARKIAAQLAAFGKVEIEKTEQGGSSWYSVNLYDDGRSSLDEMLQAAWDHGANDALAVRD
jgi:rare lipoprotein A